MRVSLSTIKSATVATQLVLISPAALFMAALVVRTVEALQYGPALTAQRVVSWYSERMWTLWVLLVALPLMVLVIGCATLLRSWSEDADLPQAVGQLRTAIRTQLGTMVIAAASLAAGCVLVVVILHMLAN